MIQDAGLWIQHDCSIAPNIAGVPVKIGDRVIGHVSYATDDTVYITLYAANLHPVVYYEDDDPMELNLAGRQ